MPIHDVKPNLNRSQSESLPVNDSGALTNLGFSGLRLGSADVVDCVVAVNRDTADCATVRAALVA